MMREIDRLIEATNMQLAIETRYEVIDAVFYRKYPLLYH